MEQLELVIVQFKEVQRLIEVDRTPQLRLAFILIDSATELVLHRMVQGTLLPEEPLLRLLDSYRRGREVGHGSEALNELIADLEGKVTSKTQRKKLEYFAPKIDFLIRRDALPGELGPVLKALHEYRNETYHRDKHRLAVLRPAVLMYFDAACSVLACYRPSMVTPNRDFGPEMAHYLGRSESHMFSLGLLDLPEKVARQLRIEVGLDAHTVRDALVDHLNARLDEACDNLNYLEDTVPDLEEGDAILLAQLSDDDVDAIFNLEVMRTRQYEFSMNDLLRWREQISRLEVYEDHNLMFTEYIKIEREFESLEQKIRRTVENIDSAIQLQIDAALGK